MKMEKELKICNWEFSRDSKGITIDAKCNMLLLNIEDSKKLRDWLNKVLD